MHFLRSLFFNFATYCGSFFSTLLALPTLVMPKSAMQWLARMLGFYIIFCVRFIINTKIIFKGLENIPKDRRFFVASAHQSICETFVFNAVLDAPIFIVKQELFKIPFYGWCIKKLGFIGTKREKVTKDHLVFLEKTTETIHKERFPLIIFPQGTRIKNNEKVPLKKGVARIYERAKVPCIPVKLNTGDVWPRDSFFRFPGEICIEFKKPIEPGLDIVDFMKILEKEIYE
jgi:1-acyl-sn-glycerol-3-phosphate acyltransferase